MKFVIDANLPYSAKTLFEPYGIATHVRDFGLADAPDNVIFARSIKEGAVLITRDLDFGNPHIYPWASHHGIVIIRAPSWFSAKQTNGLINEFLKTFDFKSLSRAVVIIEPGRIRISRTNS